MEKGIRPSHAPPQKKVPGNRMNTYLDPSSPLHWRSLARTARQQPRVQKLPLLYRSCKSANTGKKKRDSTQRGGPFGKGKKKVVLS